MVPLRLIRFGSLSRRFRCFRFFFRVRVFFAQRAGDRAGDGQRPGIDPSGDAAGRQRSENGFCGNVADQEIVNDVQHGAAGTRVNVSIKVKGSMQDLVKWLTDLQKPDQFYAVSLFSLKADQDQKSMVCTLQIARYFKGGS